MIEARAPFSRPPPRIIATGGEPWYVDQSICAIDGSTSHGKNWSPVAQGKPSVKEGEQAKHDPNHNYFKQGPTRSEFTHPDPQGLINKFAGTGQPVNGTPRGQGGFRERVDFQTTIGKHNGVPTQKGIVHYAQDGTVHIVPAAP